MRNTQQDGVLHDITPTPHNEQRILFVRDDAMTYDFAGVRRRRISTGRTQQEMRTRIAPLVPHQLP
jgi:hypothetical protein